MNDESFGRLAVITAVVLLVLVVSLISRAGRKKPKRKNLSGNASTLDMSSIMLIQDVCSPPPSHSCDPGHHASSFDAGCDSHH